MGGEDFQTRSRLNISLELQSDGDGVETVIVGLSEACNNIYLFVN